MSRRLKIRAYREAYETNAIGTHTRDRQSVNRRERPHASAIAALPAHRGRNQSPMRASCRTQMS